MYRGLAKPIKDMRVMNGPGKGFCKDCRFFKPWKDRHLGRCSQVSPLSKYYTKWNPLWPACGKIEAEKTEEDWF